MRNVSCKLIKQNYLQNEIGSPVPQEPTITEIPIIKVEDIYAKEFYEANQAGYQPTLRLRISALNYNKEEELEYMGIIYTIIRPQEITADELILVCERKIKDVKSN